MTDEYTPYRIMKSFVVPGPNEKYLMIHFPGGKIKRVGKKRGWQSIYTFKSVVNSPTPDEIRLFKATKHARLIPQDPGGFDVRDSNLARSIKTSVEGRRKHLLVVAKRKFAAEEAVRKAAIEKQMESIERNLPLTASKLKPKAKPKPVKQKEVEIPRLKSEPLPEMQTEPSPARKVTGDFGDTIKAVHKKRDEEKEDVGTGMPLISGTVVKLDTESKTKESKLKRKKHKYKIKSDSEPNKTEEK